MPDRHIDIFPARMMLLTAVLTLAAIVWVSGNSLYIHYLITHAQSQCLADAADTVWYMLYFTVLALGAWVVTWYLTSRAIQRWRSDAEAIRGSLASSVIELRHSQHEAVKAKEEAEIANSSKSDFLSNMSHELRTPMHSILNHADIGLKHLAKNEPEKVSKCLNNIHVSGRRLLALINDLLDLSKLEAGKMVFKPVHGDFMEVVQETLCELEPLLKEKEIRVCIDRRAEITDACFDPRGMTQVMVNVLSNAIKYSPQHSMIQIGIDERFRNGGIERPPCLMCEISDQGIGIPENELETIFDKFVQSTKTKNNAGGTGLGLSICKEIMQAHDGAIWAESLPGRGATFKILVPVAPVAAEGWA